MLNQPHVCQQLTFQQLLKNAKNTAYGRQYDFASIHNYTTFRERLPIHDYDTIKPFIERVMKGEQNVLWPSSISWFAKSSGTTSDKSKFIPVSKEALNNCHFRGGRDLMAMYCKHVNNTGVFNGKGLVLGGSHEINQLNNQSKYGDVSAVMMANMSKLASYIRTPSMEISLLDDWEEKIERIAETTLKQNVTHIAGVPTWTMVLIKRIFELTGTDNLKDVWPELELYIHGGVSFMPYREQFKQMIRGGNFNFIEA